MPRVCGLPDLSPQRAVAELFRLDRGHLKVRQRLRKREAVRRARVFHAAAGSELAGVRILELPAGAVPGPSVPRYALRAEVATELVDGQALQQPPTRKDAADVVEARLTRYQTSRPVKIEAEPSRFLISRFSTSCQRLALYGTTVSFQAKTATLTSAAIARQGDDLEQAHAHARRDELVLTSPGPGRPGHPPAPRSV